MTDEALPPSASLHLPRRIFHMLSGTLIVLLATFYFPQKAPFVMALGIVLLFDLLIEGLRLIASPFNSFTKKCMGPLMRSGEEARISGVAYYLGGCLLSALLFPRDIALLSILYLAFGDPIASLFGVLFGKNKYPSELEIREKSWEGSLACFICCFLLTFGLSFYLRRTETFIFSDRLVFSLLGGFSAALGELIPLRTDDNLALPLVAGCVLWLSASLLNLMPGIYF